jgi:hypothetical protein
MFSFYPGYTNRLLDVIAAAPENDVAELLSTASAPVSSLITPNLQREVRDFFGCDTLAGAELEDDGGSGTAITHLETRLFQVIFLHQHGSDGLDTPPDLRHHVAIFCRVVSSSITFSWSRWKYVFHCSSNEDQFRRENSWIRLARTSSPPQILRLLSSRTSLSHGCKTVAGALGSCLQPLNLNVTFPNFLPLKERACNP